jgi:hypothetical protein
MAGVLQRLPGDLQELAVLRIEDRGFLRREAKELGIETVETLQQRRRRDVVRARISSSVSRRTAERPSRRFSQ